MEYIKELQDITEAETLIKFIDEINNLDTLVKIKENANEHIFVKYIDEIDSLYTLVKMRDAISGRIRYLKENTEKGTRYFKVINPDNQMIIGTYSGKTPKQAAKKALVKMLQFRKSDDGPIKIVIHE